MSDEAKRLREEARRMIEEADMLEHQPMSDAELDGAEDSIRAIYKAGIETDMRLWQEITSTRSEEQQALAEIAKRLAVEARCWKARALLAETRARAREEGSDGE